MAATRIWRRPHSARASERLGTAEHRPLGSAAVAAGPVQGTPRGAPEWMLWRGMPSDAAAACRPWKGENPTAAAALLARCLAAGVVSQETLDLTCRKTPCFVKLSEMEKMADIQAEINEVQPEKKLKIEILQLEKETADIAHHFYLGKKCEILQDMNRHLEAVLKNKKCLRKRLIKPKCQDSLPIEATFHKYIVELLAEAVTFIEKLESHLQALRSIPRIPNIMRDMDTAWTKTELLVMELEELTKQILKWRELQKEVYSASICNTAELDFGLS
ncbi:HAUS augmin-like complex subunit 2 isoform X1 [Falco cherrug]|uniref:HAUS augmin-like complex subunit 2 isoform X1 n=1 Tax=Falco cherrug TaxID=345164 RepID=UPI0024789EF1|nr:HAUS augmin-like complex subunit 2 isoform X1 [Falco cherrug]